MTIGNEMPCRIEEETMRLLLTPDQEESSVYFIGGKDEIVFSSETEEADIYKEPSSAQTGAFICESREDAGLSSLMARKFM